MRKDKPFEINDIVWPKTKAGLELSIIQYDNSLTVQNQPNRGKACVFVGSGVIRNVKPVTYRYDQDTMYKGTPDIPTWIYLIECDSGIGWASHGALLPACLSSEQC